MIKNNGSEIVSVWRLVTTTRCLTPPSFGGYDVEPHYNDVVNGAMSSQITSLTIVYSIVYSGANQRKHQSSAPLAFVWGIHRWPVNSPHKWLVARKMFPFDEVIMFVCITALCSLCDFDEKISREELFFWWNINFRIIRLWYNASNILKKKWYTYDKLVYVS